VRTAVATIQSIDGADDADEETSEIRRRRRSDRVALSPTVPTRAVSLAKARRIKKADVVRGCFFTTYAGVHPPDRGRGVFLSVCLCVVIIVGHDSSTISDLISHGRAGGTRTRTRTTVVRASDVFLFDLDAR